MGGMIGGLFGESTPDAPNVQVWQPQNASSADSLYYNTLANQTQNNPYQQMAPAYQRIYQQGMSNPYAQGAQTAANQSGQAMGQQGQQNIGLAPQLMGAAQQGLGYANQTMQQAQDPQNALYNRTLQQLQDQVRTSNAARGIDSSGYGAGLENQALSNFNIDWQGQALNRSLAGLAGYDTSVKTAAGVGGQASNLGQMGAMQLGQAGQIPSNAYNQNLQDQSSYLNQFTGAGAQGQGLQNQNLGQLLSYMGLGAQQSNSQGNFDFQNYNAQLQAAQASQQGIGNFVNNAIGFGMKALPFLL